jgi:hypothetical protein
MAMSETELRLGRLTLMGPFGRTDYTVRILGRFLWYYRIEAVTLTRLKGNRALRPGERALVPWRFIRHIRLAEN